MRCYTSHFHSRISRLITCAPLGSLLTFVLGPLISHPSPLPVSAGQFVSLAGAAFHGLGHYLSSCLSLCQGCALPPYPRSQALSVLCGPSFPWYISLSCLHQPSCTSAGSIFLHCSSHSWAFTSCYETSSVPAVPLGLSFFLFFITLCVCLQPDHSFITETRSSVALGYPRATWPHATWLNMSSKSFGRVITNGFYYILLLKS